MERVKHLKLPQHQRQRSHSFDMIVMDEVSKIIGDLDNAATIANNNSSPNLTSLDSPRGQSTSSSTIVNSLPLGGGSAPPSPIPSRHQSFSIHHSPSNSSISSTTVIPMPPLTITTALANENNNNNNNNSSNNNITTPNQSISGSNNLNFQHQHTSSNTSSNNNFNTLYSTSPKPTPLENLHHIYKPNPHHISISILDKPVHMNERSPSFSNLPGELTSSGHLRRTSLFAQNPPPLSLDGASPLNQSNGSNNSNGIAAGRRKSIMSSSTILPPPKKSAIIKRRLLEIIESPYYLTLMTLAILFILFIDDIIGIAGSPYSEVLNIVLLAIRFFIVVYFTVDIVINVLVYGRHYYNNTPAILLDIISTLSIVPDIVFAIKKESLPFELQVLVIGQAGRIIRFCGSYIRVSLVATLHHRIWRPRTKTQDNLQVEASKLGDKLIREIINKIVLLVLLVFFATQLLTIDHTVLYGYESSLSNLQFQYINNPSTFTPSLNNYMSSIGSSSNQIDILYLSISNNQFFNDQSKIDSLQFNAILKYDFQSSSIWLDNSSNIRKTSIMHLCLTVFVILILIIVNIAIIRDSYKIVINPLENVLAIVKTLSKQNAAIQRKSEMLDTGDLKMENDAQTGQIDDDESDEADYLLGMLSDIDGSLQAAKEKVEEESIQNSRLKSEIEDLYATKFVLQIHLDSVLRQIEFEDKIGSMLEKNREIISMNAKQLPEGINSDSIKFKVDESNPEKFIIICATLDKLIDRLTKIDNHDMKFANVFLLTFRRFISPIELLERLVIRFCSTPSMELSPNQLESDDYVTEWRSTKQDQLRISVFNVIKLWIAKFFWDFGINPELSSLLQFLLKTIMPKFNMERYAVHLEALLRRKQEGYIPLIEYQPLPPLSSEDIAQMMVIDDRVLFNFDVNEIAVQITLIEFEMFKSIRPEELLDLAWTKNKTKFKTSPNVARFTEHFNSVSFWIQMQIVKYGKVKERVAALKRIISLGDAFLQLNNYYGAMEVLASLESASVSRLAKTWEQLPSASQQSFQTLQRLLSPNGSYKEYRERLKQTTSACIPYLGVYLTDLTFIYEGNPDYRDQLVNYTKQREIAATILSIQQFQNTLEYYHEVNEKLKSQLDLRAPDTETIYKMSLTAEPRRN